jgi:anaerobic magnesium-protoporphyrin IX monomethyl ester cyclase
MARVLFIQNIPFEYMGPMYLSAVLKNRGHNCRILIAESHRDFLPHLMEYQPDLIAFSTMTGPHKWVIETASIIKQHVKRPVILGGPHPTFFPEIIDEPCVDMICLGEGELALLELADRLDHREDISGIKNLWVKKGSDIVRNELRPLIGDLDALPFPDRTLYDDCKLLRSVPAMKFLTGRGCPYHCSFCFNHRYNELYRGSGPIVRKRGIDSLIEEIKATVKAYNLKLVRFPDDSFTIKRQWLLEFLAKYRKSVNLPFTALTRANELDDMVVGALKSAGCLNLYFGVETGSENLRNRILKKKLSDKQLLDASRSLKKCGVKFGTYNMFGLPNENLEMAFETITFNWKLKPDYTINNVFQPYPRTEIVDYAQEQGYLDPNICYLDTMNEGSLVKTDGINRIVNLSRFASLAIRYPFLMPLIKQLIKLPPNKIFKLAFELSSAPAMKSNLNLNWISLLRWGIYMRKIV